MIDVAAQNRSAWNRESASGEGEWSQPVDIEMTERARGGEVNVILTPNRFVPRDWFGKLAGARVLGLASGGGQQVPLLAAAGGQVTSFDNSDEQLARDREVAQRDGLEIRYEQGDMMDLSRFEPESFDLIFNPVSTVFIPDVEKVWQEARRVLKPGGRLLTGVMNPAFYLFDHDAIEGGAEPVVKFALPFDDTRQLDPEGLAKRIAAEGHLEFSHTLDSLIGGLLRSGFVLQDFYEDDWSDEATPLNKYMKVSFAMLAEAV